MKKPLKIYVDVSETYYNKLQTGIQRVVRQVSHDLLCGPNVSNIEISLYVNHSRVNRKFISSSLDLMELGNNETHERTRERLLNFLIRQWGILNESVFSWILDRKELLLFVDAFSKFFFRGVRVVGGTHVNEPGNPDYLLILDSYWDRGNEVIEFVSEFKAAGARVGLMIYDVIPLSHPHFVTKQTMVKFRKYIGPLTVLADDIFTISNFSRSEIRRFLAEEVEQKNITVVPLGNIADRVGIKNGLDYRNKKSVLFIGTIEPRKNLEVLIDWWERTGRKDNYSLTIIGRPGWKSRSLLEKLVSFNETDEKFNWLGQVSDEELKQELLTNVVGVIPSFIEGFGLPIIEMANAGLRVVASDIPIFREVAPEHTLFFDPNDSRSLGEAISNAVNLTPLEIKTASWKDSSQVILRAILETFEPDEESNL